MAASQLPNVYLFFFLQENDSQYLGEDLLPWTDHNHTEYLNIWLEEYNICSSPDKTANFNTN